MKEDFSSGNKNRPTKVGDTGRLKVGDTGRLKVGDTSKKILKISGYVLIVLLLLSIALFDLVDWTPYRQMPYYRAAKEELARFSPARSRGDTLKAGWAKRNITPQAPVDMAGYGRRGEYERVRDSVWVRTMVFSNGGVEAAIISFDLLIVHPSVASRIKKELGAKGIEDVYFAATHTHHGFGGWAAETGGQLIIGDYDEKVVDFLVAKAVEAVSEARSKLEKAATAYQQFDAADYVQNRLDDNGNEDPFLRVVEVRTASGKTALLTTFAAHSTSLSSKVKELSGDYPGVLVRTLEKNPQVDFAMFCMGATASHKPVLKDPEYETMALYARQLADTISRHIHAAKPDSSARLEFGELPVHLREPHLRIAREIRLRPWVFRMLFGEIHPTIDYLRVGNQVFLGMPCDFSGELYPDFEKTAREKGFHLVITSFNGAYIGYVTNDKYYNLPRGETRDMNWFGPYNSAYFGEIVGTLLEKL